MTDAAGWQIDDIALVTHTGATSSLPGPTRPPEATAFAGPELRAFPNPFRDRLRVEFDHGAPAVSAAGRLRVIDATGQPSLLR